MAWSCNNPCQGSQGEVFRQLARPRPPLGCAKHTIGHTWRAGTQWTSQRGCRQPGWVAARPHQREGLQRPVTPRTAQASQEACTGGGDSRKEESQDDVERHQVHSGALEESTGRSTSTSSQEEGAQASWRSAGSAAFQKEAKGLGRWTSPSRRTSDVRSACTTRTWRWQRIRWLYSHFTVWWRRGATTGSNWWGAATRPIGRWRSGWAIQNRGWASNWGTTAWGTSSTWWWRRMVGGAQEAIWRRSTPACFGRRPAHPQEEASTDGSCTGGCCRQEAESQFLCSSGSDHGLWEPSERMGVAIRGGDP